MTEFLNELSENQINYLKQQKKHKYIVGISRILILFSFLFLWEFTANVGIIDSFIFSSPSKIALCFWGMVLDKSIFLHTNLKLPARHRHQYSGYHSSLVQQTVIRNPGSLPGSTEQSAEVCTCTTSYCLAWSNKNNNYRRRNVCSNLWKHSELIHQFYDRRSRKTETHLYTGWKSEARASKSRTSFFSSGNHQ
mgnify:FL=1